MVEQAFSAVKKLVQDFKSQESAYLSPSYQESRVRQDFIDKFFTALGWDVTHNVQKNPYQQEVHIENKVQVAGSQRRADYAFFLAPNFRDPKFFVEAKKPSRNLANPDDYYQTVRYAWNAGTGIAVLTDFEEFHILDCRYKPDIRDVMGRKIEYFHYSDYANEEKFARIYWLFSHEAVASGSIERRIAELQRPRGKAIQRGLFKGGYQPVDEAFLVELDEYREVLAKAFKKTNPDLHSEELTEAVQRTIDRLVFIRFLEDKQIEEPEIINLRSKKSAWMGFLELCRRLDPKYNGLVFKSHRILDKGEFVPPDDEEFVGICDELADPSSPYNFDQIPISILGSIYERFLGKVVHATSKRVKIEEKPEVRKAGGVYYTPDYIVRYIVKETVGKIVEGKTPEEISKMAFADIACGSGSFLIEVYNLLLDYHERFYAEHPEKAKKGDIEIRDVRKVLSLKKRQEILVSNIYGVDIDYQATEVTQLSLYLKLLEDVTMNDAYQFHLLHEKMLPNLNRNIICGNSLVDTGISDGILFSDLIESKLSPMNFQDVFPEVMKRGGFDAVVGNPPYVRMEEFKEIKDYLRREYKAHEERSDLYAYFIERAHKILRRDGRFGMIVSNKFLRANYGAPLRAFLRMNSGLERVVDFAGLPVFRGATVRTIILLTSKTVHPVGSVYYSPPLAEEEFKQLSSGLIDVETAIRGRGFTVDLKSLENDIWSFSDPASIDVFTKLKRKATPLKEYCTGHIFRGVVSGLAEAFVIDELTRKKLIKENPDAKEIIKPFLNGREIKSFQILWKNQFLIYTYHGVNIKKYPAIERHLQSFKTKLQNRATKQRWYELQQPQLAFAKYMDGPKIIFPDIATEPRFALDDAGFYSSNTTYFIPLKDLYLLALLNSKVGEFYFKKVCAGLEGKNETYLRFFGQYLEGFPVRMVDLSDSVDKALHDQVVSLVERMLATKGELNKAKTESETTRLERECEALERQIDQAVYELYGLTEEEIKVVEGK